MPARKTNRRDAIESDAPGILLGACILAVLAMLLIASLLAGLAAGPLKPGNATILLGVYLIGVGALFAASHRWTRHSFLFRGVLWVCEHFSSPKGRWMALVYAAIFATIGTVVLGKGLGFI